VNTEEVDGDRSQKWNCEADQKMKRGHLPDDDPALWEPCGLLSTNRIFFCPSASFDFFQKSVNEGRPGSPGSSITPVALLSSPVRG
jgi:hypothetical protein